MTGGAPGVDGSGLRGPRGSVGFSGNGPSTSGVGPGFDDAVPGDKIDHDAGTFSGS